MAAVEFGTLLMNAPLMNIADREIMNVEGGDIKRVEKGRHELSTHWPSLHCVSALLESYSALHTSHSSEKNFNVF